MKQFIITALLVGTLQLCAMEKSEDQYPLDQLPTDMRNQIMVSMVEAAASESTVQEAITEFNRLSLVNSFFRSQKSTDIFLDALLRKFPGQEVRIARALKNSYAQQWIKRVQPDLKSYSPRYVNQKELFAVTTFIKRNQINFLQQWLNQGYDPNAIATEGLLLFIAIREHNLEAVKLLIAYGADVNATEREFYYDAFAITPLQLVQREINTHTYDPVAIEQLNAIDDYLRSQGAL